MVSILVVVVVVFEEDRFLLAINRHEHFGLNSLRVIAAGTHQRQQFRILELEDRASDLGSLVRREGEFLFRPIGRDTNFHRFDFGTSTHQILEVDGQRLFVIVVGPLEMGGRVGIEMRDVTAVRSMLGMVVPFILVIASMIVAVVVIMVVIMVVVVTRLDCDRSRAFLGGWFRIATEPDGNSEDEKCRKREPKLHCSPNLVGTT